MCNCPYFSVTTVLFKRVLIYFDHTPADERVGPSITGAEATRGSRPEKHISKRPKEVYHGWSTGGV
jgi:hypothetical protein